MAMDWYTFRGFDRETVCAARAWYRKFLPTSGMILDVGCGRGEFLDVAVETGMTTRGVDCDPAMLKCASAHDVVEADALDYLQATDDQFVVISALHVVEHFSVDDAAALIRLCGDRLSSGGALILATPNPGSLPTITHEFWRDPTHVRPYDVDLLGFLCRAAGLNVVESGLNPSASRGLPVDLDDLDIIEGVSDEKPGGVTHGPITRWVGQRLAETGYAADLEAAIHSLSVNLRHTRDELHRVTSVVRRVIDVAYEPSEIYVVARRT